MNCFQFRQLLDAEPVHLPVEAQTHLCGCDACRALHNQRLHDEDALLDVLNIEVPEGLEDRILLRVKFQQKKQQRRWWPVAIAASLLCVALVAKVALPLHSLTDEMASHVANEQRLFTKQEIPSRDAVSLRLAALGGELTGNLPAVLLEKCDVPGGDGSHIVLATEAGRVVMTLMPNLRSKAQSSIREGYLSEIYAQGNSAYGLVAQNPRAMQIARQMLQTEVSWHT